MSFVQKITSCLENCSKVIIKDITGFFNSETNPESYNDNSTLWRSSDELISPRPITATITITKSGVTVIENVSVLSAIVDAIFPEFTLYTFEPDTLEDGSYQVIVTIVDDNDVTYISYDTFTITCGVECCISKMAATVAKELCNQCDSEALDNLAIANSIFEALTAVATCDGTQEFDSLLAKLQKICGSTGCGCGCN